METFAAASHGEILRLLVQIAVLLAAARILGGLAQRLGQPAVAGEILAGVVVGPSLLSGLVPQIGEWVLPQTQVGGQLLEVVALIGVMLLLVVTGLEIDLALIRRRAGTALGVGIGGLVVPLASGLALGYGLPADLLVDPGQRTVFALFVATALSISALPVLAKMLIDLGLMRREVGQTMLAAGMINDIAGWTLLGLVTALVGAEVLTTQTVVRTVGMVVVFLVATVTVGSWLVRRGLALMQDRFRGPDHVLTFVIVAAFAWGAFTQALRLEPIIGAFAVGILLGRLRRLPADVANKLEGMAFGFFAPIFFAVAGLKVDIGAILQPRLLAVTAVVIAVATVGKVAGAYAGARLLSRQDHWSALTYGVGLNARGALEIIIASVGLSLGILTQDMFSIIVVMAVATSIMAPIALRYTLARVEPGAEEQRRLETEGALEGTFVSGLRRVLVPVRPRAQPVAGTHVIAAAVMRRLEELHDLSTTLYAVADPGRRDHATRHLADLRATFGLREVTTRVVSGDDPVELILREAGAGYDLVMVGTPTVTNSATSLFGPVIDDLVKISPLPTLVVRGREVAADWAPRHILVPINGTRAARRAADLAFAIADHDAMVTGIHVVVPSPRGAVYDDLARDVTAELEEVGATLDRHTTTHVRQAPDPETGILEAVGDIGADLLVLGTNVRAGTTRLHLGPRVEYLAANAPCPVLILNT